MMRRPGDRAKLARRLCRIPTRHVARRFGRDDSAFSRPLASLEDQLTTDDQLRHRIETLVRTLRQSAAASAASTPTRTNNSTSQD